MSQFVPTVIVEQSALIREGLVRILTETRYRVSRVCSHIDELEQGQIDGDEFLLLLGLNAVSTLDMSKVRHFKDQHVGAKIIVLSSNVLNGGDLATAFAAGADCFLSKRVSSDALLKSFDLVLVGETIIPRECLHVLAQRLDEYDAVLADTKETCASDRDFAATHVQQPNRLSLRERQILTGVTQGASNKVIARELNMAEATVKVHIKGILRKIGVKNRTQAAVWALNSDRQT